MCENPISGHSNLKLAHKLVSLVMLCWLCLLKGSAQDMFAHHDGHMCKILKLNG